MFKFLILLSIFSTSLSAFAQSENECPKEPLILNVIFNNNELKYDYEQNARYIKDIVGKDGNINKQAFSIGVTVTNTNLQIKPIMNLSIKKIDGVDHFCAFIAQMDIIMDFKPVIYIASESKGLTCISNTILKHENKHYQITLDELNQFQDKAKITTSTIISPHFEASSKQEVKDKINQQIKKLGDSLFQNVQKDIMPKNQELDNNESYDKLQFNCLDEDVKSFWKKVR